ncbi:MAG: segregation and condensation protein B [Cellvibrionaceae bacterium]|jgi:segregation and condensation protein B
MESKDIQRIIEAAMLAYSQPLSVDKLQSLFAEDHLGPGEQQLPEKAAILEVLEQLAQSCEGRGFELKQVSTGWRFQIRENMARWVNRLWQEKPPRYSRALLETLAIIAYRQPVTRGDIEDIRGVSVSSAIIKTLAEREWIKVVGQRDVPGRPSLYATTRSFLDYFNLQNLEQLPPLKELDNSESEDLQLGPAPTGDGGRDKQRDHRESKKNPSGDIFAQNSVETTQLEIISEGGITQDEKIVPDSALLKTNP